MYFGIDTNYIVTLSSPNLIGIITSKKMNWAVHVAHMEDMKNKYSVLVSGKPKIK
jgi:hypothetical protein